MHHRSEPFCPELLTQGRELIRTDHNTNNAYPALYFFEHIHLLRVGGINHIFRLLMEIFGSTFDDSVFLEARDRVSVALTTYNAKLCEPEVRVSFTTLLTTLSTLLKMTITESYTDKLWIRWDHHEGSMMRKIEIMERRC